jgi:hypothetical protein
MQKVVDRLDKIKQSVMQINRKMTRMEQKMARMEGKHDATNTEIIVGKYDQSLEMYNSSLTIGDNFLCHNFAYQTEEWNGTTKDLKPEVRLIEQNGMYHLYNETLGTDIVKIHAAIVSKVILPKEWFPLNIRVRIAFNCNIHDVIGIENTVRFYSDGYVTRTD